MHPHYLDFGGAGTLIHLAPANGFPPEAYRPLAACLTPSYRVLGYRPRPLWAGSTPSQVRTWRDLAYDMLADMQRVTADPVIGIGHSLGGILTLYCAVLRPDRFHGAALIDPVLFPRHLLPVIWAAQRLGLHRHFPIARSAARRRDRFASRDEARAHFQGRGIFANFTPEALEGYLEGALRPASDGGLTLSWPRAWEARIFSLIPVDAWDALERLRVPLLLVRGIHSDLIIDRSWAELKRRLPGARLVELDAGHMAPMERPAEVGRIVMDWAARLPMVAPSVRNRAE